ncbi:hypothetical protein P3T36_001456 [Kitasatospora sp. MAP12-15]|uniref:hypothetical protein n=1 Tax=unclassified Kitasatospora TaxID=2633591 RepID=UPI002476CC8F|nr:hypothetical protein [Kitasatospora sp. MAP12-44]MDH6112574.1 hypothetical protein [Kitasatospora sp. MAP12-44]
MARWLAHGSGVAELARALLPGLPAVIHSPVAVIRNRLQRKMPSSDRREVRRYAECVKCHDPVPAPGVCRSCAGLGSPRQVNVGGGAAVAAAGAARVRAAMCQPR